MATVNQFNAAHHAAKPYFSPSEEQRMREEDAYTWTTVTTVLVSIVMLGFLGMTLTVALVALLGS